MAIDTETKRRTAGGITLPVPTGIDNRRFRRAVVYTYYPEAVVIATELVRHMLFGASKEPYALHGASRESVCLFGPQADGVVLKGTYYDSD